MAKKSISNLPRRMYSLDENGKWWVRTFADQCDGTVLFNVQCQGAKGHEGAHWRYNSAGYLEYGQGSMSEIIPPGHKKYRSPEQMAPLYHLNNASEFEEVVDAKLIARLEAGHIPDNASVTRPVKIIKSKKVK